jgi:16S rRNA (guanine1516-N2)-methyltransferase
VSLPVLKPHVAIAAEVTSLQDRARELAQELALPSTQDLADRRFDYLLVLTAERLELREPARAAPGPVYVDFLSAALTYRRRFGGGRRQPLARAIGIRGKSAHLAVLDATAGLGRDSFVLACLGCDVQMVERSPLIAALLRDGLERAEQDPEMGSLIRAHLNLVMADSCRWMAELDKTLYPEVIYLDPMYPHRMKSALVKKEMRLLRAIVGEDQDASALLSAALQCARKRVVVKRPRYAFPVQGPKPSLCIQSLNTRFDVYVINQPKN